MIPTAATVRSRRIACAVHTLDGSRCLAQVGYWGCSIKAHPPVSANRRKTSMLNRISLDPMSTCRHARSGMLGIPFGHLPERTGGGPLSSRRAAEKDSQGGPPPAPHTCPVLMRSSHHVRDVEEVRSPLSLWRHMSTDSTNSWWPCGEMRCSSKSWRSPLRRNIGRSAHHLGSYLLPTGRQRLVGPLQTR